VMFISIPWFVKEQEKHEYPMGSWQHVCQSQKYELSVVLGSDFKIQRKKSWSMKKEIYTAFAKITMYNV